MPEAKESFDLARLFRIAKTSAAKTSVGNTKGRDSGQKKKRERWGACGVATNKDSIRGHLWKGQRPSRKESTILKEKGLTPEQKEAPAARRGAAALRRNHVGDGESPITLWGGWSTGSGKW